MNAMPAHASVATLYRSTQLKTCSPAQLVVLLYDGIFRFAGEAKAAMSAKDWARAGERTSRIHAILEHLLTGLDSAAAPELAATLSSLYVHCMTEVVSANAQRDPGKLDDVLRVLSPLRDAWREMKDLGERRG